MDDIHWVWPLGAVEKFLGEPGAKTRLKLDIIDAGGRKHAHLNRARVGHLTRACGDEAELELRGERSGTNRHVPMQLGPNARSGGAMRGTWTPFAGDVPLDKGGRKLYANPQCHAQG